MKINYIEKMKKYLLILVILFIISFSVKSQSPKPTEWPLPDPSDEPSEQPSETESYTTCRDGAACNTRQEDCDLIDPNPDITGDEYNDTCGKTCSSFVEFVGGPLGCTSDCKFDFSKCIECYKKEDCEGKSTELYCSAGPDYNQRKTDIWGNKAGCVGGECGPGLVRDCQEGQTGVLFDICYSVNTGSMSQEIYCVGCITDDDCPPIDRDGTKVGGWCKKTEYRFLRGQVPLPPEQWECKWPGGYTPTPWVSPVASIVFTSTESLTTTDPTSQEVQDYMEDISIWVDTPPIT